MTRIGITGQNGFIGQHLVNTLGLLEGEFEIVEFERSFFEIPELLKNFVSECDVIVHLAALNRHNDPDVIYDVNVELVRKLVSALDASASKAHVLFSSSSQEENDNLYGRSKKAGRALLSEWAKRSEGKFTALLIPNVFGPFGHPFYNSFIATFCHQLTHDCVPRIEVDSTVNLIYVGELVDLIISEIKVGQGNELYTVPSTIQKTVSEILNLLMLFRNQYVELGIIPELATRFEVNLFNTFRSYMDIESFFPVKLVQHGDSRGVFVEVIRLNVGGQISFSTTLPGITRGNHYHTRKIERFTVIKGEARIQLRKIGDDKVLNFELNGMVPSYVDMPIWYTHNITNVGQDELYTIFWINELYDSTDPDTYFENVE